MIQRLRTHNLLQTSHMSNSKIVLDYLSKIEEGILSYDGAGNYFSIDSSFDKNFISLVSAVRDAQSYEVVEYDRQAIGHKTGMYMHGDDAVVIIFHYPEFRIYLPAYLDSEKIKFIKVLPVKMDISTQVTEPYMEWGKSGTTPQE